MPLKGAIVPVTPFQQNCAVLWDDATMRAAVIDPGGDVPRILAAIEETGAKPTKIVLTHGHIDHAGGVEDLKGAWRDKTGATLPVEGPDARDRFLLEGIEAQARAYGIEGVRNATVDRFLVEGDAVEIAGFDFAVLHCPGHTPGHLVFASEALRFAVVGDVLFQGSVGRTDFPYGDHAALLHSIKTKLWPLGDDVGFVCGHGPGSTFGQERASNPFVGD